MKSRYLITALLTAMLAVNTSAAEDESGTKSAEEVAKELANPNNSLASLTFKNQFHWYDGGLPGADDQSNYTLLFQPVFPFSLGETSSGGNAVLFIRPAIPVVVDRPIFAAGNADFKGVSGLGDIGFDVAYGVTEKDGLIWAVGVVGALPTGSDSRLTSGQFTLGPNVLLARLNPGHVYGILVNHQWDYAGWGDRSVSLTTFQPIMNFIPGGGWTVGTSGLFNYDWRSEQWTAPLNLTVTKTVMMGKTPVKIGLEINYYFEHPDAFGPEWMIGLNLTPVVPNFVEGWIRGNANK